MKRVKKKYQTPVIHSIELGPISPVTASSDDVTIGSGGNASGGGGTPPPMQSPPRDLWESGLQTDNDDETAYEYGW